MTKSGLAADSKAAGDAIGSISTLVGNKVDKENGKGLSTNDFTNEYKTKLDGLENLIETDPTVPAWAKTA